MYFPQQDLGRAHKIVRFGSFQGVSDRSVGLLFLEIFGILEGNFSYFVEFIYRTYKMICTSYGIHQELNF